MLVSPYIPDSFKVIIATSAIAIGITAFSNILLT